jgi:hypothetical protein
MTDIREMIRLIITFLAVAITAIYLEWRYRKSCQNEKIVAHALISTPMQLAPEPEIPEKYLEAWCHGTDEIGHCTVHGYQNCPQHRTTVNIDPDTIPEDQRCLGRSGMCECPEHRQIVTALANNCSGGDEIGYCATHGYQRCSAQPQSTGYNYIKRVGNAFATPVHDN